MKKDEKIQQLLWRELDRQKQQIISSDFQKKYSIVRNGHAKDMKIIMALISMSEKLLIMGQQSRALHYMYFLENYIDKFINEVNLDADDKIIKVFRNI